MRLLIIFNELSLPEIKMKGKHESELSGEWSIYIYTLPRPSLAFVASKILITFHPHPTPAALDIFQIPSAYSQWNVYKRLKR